MAGREFTLSVPQSLEAAYLLIIGQIAFVYSKILFELLSVFISDAHLQLSSEKVFILVVVLLVPFILIVNILSGWLSTRATFAEFSEYPNSLFLLDMLMIIVFFVLNNVVTFSVIQPGTADYLTTLISVSTPSNSVTMTSEIARIVPPFVYLCSGLICILYVFWNKFHQKERARLTHDSGENPNMFAHNRFLIFASVAHVVLLALVLAVNAIIVEYVCMCFWIVIWLWLNGTWIATSPLAIKPSR